MGKRLPVKLGKEPLLEAVCEIRFKAKVGLHNVAPGLVISTLGEVGDVETLPVASLPDIVRTQNPGLMHAPLVRLQWNKYTLLVGESSFAVACNAPYSGWNQFKSDILRAFSVVLDERFVEAVDRYSIKYVNLLEESSVAKQYDLLDWQVKVGSAPIDSGPTQLRFESEDDGSLILVNIATAAVVGVLDVVKSGCVVDIDVISNEGMLGISDFKSSAADRLDKIRMQNKTKFFDCLRDSTIEALRPVYE